MDAEIADRMPRQLEQLGLRFLFNETVATIAVRGDRPRVEVKSGTVLDSDLVLIALGRRGHLQGLGLEAVGVALTPRGVSAVNEKYQTSVPSIYAAGDVIGFASLASVAMEQARVAMVHAFDLHYKEHVYAHNARGQIMGDTNGLLKLVFAPDDKRLLGVHMIGEMASELIHIGAHVLAEGGTIDAFIRAVYNYPTVSDAYKYAAYDGLGQLEKWRRSQSAD